MLYLKVENHVMRAGKSEDFLQCRNSLARKLAVVPQTHVESAEFRQGVVSHRPATIGGAFQGVVVNGDEPGVAGEMQVSFDESGS